MFWASLGSDSSFYLFDSHSKEKRQLIDLWYSSFSKLDSIYSLENYIESVYRNTYPLTLYFQVQFKKFPCTINAKNNIKYALKRATLSKATETFTCQKNKNMKI